MRRHCVGNVADIPPGSRKIVDVNGRSIGVYNVGGTYYAIRNLCPHQGAPLCLGITSSFVTSNGRGDFHFEMEGEIVRCPWHFWEFDIKTGCMVVDPRTRTKTYDVTVERYDVTAEEEMLYVHM